MVTLVDPPLDVSSDGAQVLFREARRRRRRRRAGLALLAVAAGVATYVTVSAGGGPAATSQPARGTGAASRRGAVVGTSTCRRSALRVVDTLVGGGAGHGFTMLTFQNVGRTPCSVAGVPAMSFTGRAGQPIGYTVAGSPLQPSAAGSTPRSYCWPHGSGRRSRSALRTRRTLLPAVRCAVRWRAARC
jgi:hypothetical protein